MWGAAPRPGREKSSLHPRHRCDVPEGQRGRTYRTHRTYRTELRRRTPQNQSMACEARHAPTGPRAGRAPCAHARPAPCVVLFVSFVVLCVFCGKSTLAVLSAVVDPKSAPIYEICGPHSGSPSPFVFLRGSSCTFVSAPQGNPSTPSQRPRPSPACRALRSPFSVLLATAPNAHAKIVI